MPLLCIPSFMGGKKKKDQAGKLSRAIELSESSSSTVPELIEVKALQEQLAHERKKYADLDARSKAESAKLRMQLREQERTIEKLGRERNELNDTLQSFDNGDELPLASAHETLKCERYIEHMTNIVDQVLRGKNPAGRDLFYTADDSDDERVAAPPGGFPKCGDLKSVVTATTASAGSPSNNNNGRGGGGEVNSPSNSSAPKKLRSRRTGLMKMIESLHDKLLLFLGVSSTRAVSNQERELGGKKRS